MIEPFTYRVTKAGQLLVSRASPQGVTVSGTSAERLTPLLRVDDQTDQDLLARETGNYRRGNERGSHRL